MKRSVIWGFFCFSFLMDAEARVVLPPSPTVSRLAYQKKQGDQKKRNEYSRVPVVTNAPLYFDSGTLGLPDVTIDTKPLRKQLEEQTLLGRGKTEEWPPILQGAHDFFRTVPKELRVFFSEIPRDAGAGAIGLCASPIGSQVVSSYFERGHRASGPQATVQLTQTLDSQCQARGAVLVASYVPLKLP